MKFTEYVFLRISVIYAKQHAREKRRFSYNSILMITSNRLLAFPQLLVTLCVTQTLSVRLVRCRVHSKEVKIKPLFNTLSVPACVHLVPPYIGENEALSRPLSIDTGSAKMQYL